MNRSGGNQRGAAFRERKQHADAQAAGMAAPSEAPRRTLIHRSTQEHGGGEVPACDANQKQRHNRNVVWMSCVQPRQAHPPRP